MSSSKMKIWVTPPVEEERADKVLAEGRENTQYFRGCLIEEDKCQLRPHNMLRK